MDPTIIYLLPLVFMLHEFEEIIIMPDWLQQNQVQLVRRFPATQRMFRSPGKLSAPAFTLAVAEEFILLSVCTVIATAYGHITAWYCCLLAFGIHLIVHLLQFLIIRRYIPAIVTTLLCLPYCIRAFIEAQGCFTLPQTLLWAITGSVIAAANLLFIHKIAPRIWQRMRRPPNSAPKLR